MATTPEEGAGSSSDHRRCDAFTGEAVGIRSHRGEHRPGLASVLRATGPGLVTGASAMIPPGIATYSQAGDRDGLSFLWAALLTLPLMAAGPRDLRPARRLRPAQGSASWPSGDSTGRSSDPRSAPRRPHSGERPSTLPRIWSPSALGCNSSTPDRRGTPSSPHVES